MTTYQYCMCCGKKVDGKELRQEFQKMFKIYPSQMTLHEIHTIISKVDKLKEVSKLQRKKYLKNTNHSEKSQKPQ